MPGNSDVSDILSSDSGSILKTLGPFQQNLLPSSLCLLMLGMLAVCLKPSW